MAININIRHWIKLGALLLAPALLGAKGCGVATVGHDICGGIQGKACATGDFCQFEASAQCGAGDQTGTCQPIPAVCAANYSPVCGCDGESYGNACEASQAGISVASTGECKPAAGDRVCGGLLPSGCDKGEFCSFPISATCGAADQTGVCKAIPQACTQEYAPVCGCDGKTYSTTCTANAAGVSVSANGACSADPAPGAKTCGGLLGTACAKTEFCNFPSSAACGAADQTGVCNTRPQACDAIYAPVCGCDDKTYASDCDANAAGVSVASQGECGTSGGKVCGTRGAAPCADNEFCSFGSDAECGQTDKPGYCVEKPKICTQEFVATCGCDGKTYAGVCAANAAGVSVARYGECDAAPGKSCGGLIGAACAAGEFCNYAADAMCGAADQTGTCVATPPGCPKNILQVCGCDDKTYDNACLANVAGVSVASDGACKAQGKACGARLGDTCSKGEFCHFADAAICGQADGTGVCETLPVGCPKNLAQVCGCDGQTYGNACMANAAGTSVLSQGECKASGAACGFSVDAACGKGEFCAYDSDAKCGKDAAGVCQTTPETCTTEYSPVCGCDGKTYGNTCTANAAGIAVAASGACAGSGKACGGIAGLQCAKDEYCSYTLEAQCGATDQTGTCQAKPTDVGCTADYNPVCGCDGKTYGNACSAMVAAVSVAAKGECPKDCGSSLVAPSTPCR